MRINLVDREPEPRKGRKRSKKRRSSRRFDTAISQPQGLTRRQIGKRRTPLRQRAAKTQAERREAKARPSLLKGIPWRRIWGRLPVLLILVGLLGVIGYASADARFFVYSARVQGSRYIRAETIYAAAQVHEQNTFWLQPEKVAERIAQLPGIKSARVHCSLPAQVLITVEEREPIVLWRALSQGKDHWLDKEGVVLPYHGDVKSQDMIFVVDSTARNLQAGEIISPQDIVQGVQRLAETVPGAKVFFYEPDGGLTFTQETGRGDWPVYVGDGEDLARKIQAVQALNAHFEANNIQPRFVDVRWPEMPVYGKPQNEVGTTEGGN